MPNAKTVRPARHHLAIQTATQLCPNTPAEHSHTVATTSARRRMPVPTHTPVCP
jgi:hypothetical protein